MRDRGRGRSRGRDRDRNRDRDRPKKTHRYRRMPTECSDYRILIFWLLSLFYINFYHPLIVGYCVDRWD